MGIVNRLRNLAKLIDFKIGSNLASEAADLITRLKRYANHGPNCPVSYGATDDQCLCGLSALLREIDHDRD